MSNTNLIVANTSIRQDAEGRYCLNDLHKAAGSTAHQQPAKFLANQRTNALITEIGEQAVSVVRGRGKAQGTYACKELVYAYAMWISPAFNLKVIRAYDAMHTSAPAQAMSPAQHLLYQAQMLVDLEQKQAEQEKRQSKQEAAITAIQTVVERNGAPEGYLPLGQLRTAINTYGLSDRVLKWVLIKSGVTSKRYSYTIPGGMNAYGDAWNVEQAAQQLKDFAGGVTRTSPRFYEHPDYSSRFKFRPAA